MKEKSIKDAVHGYVKLDEPFWKVIDTPVFQRLKWIEQTSFRPLFPSARHDRFIHSIGVFHLGKLAIDGFKKNTNDSDKKIIEANENSFLLACLLHDVGHAPFSHTSEKMYNYKYKVDSFSSPLVQELLNCMREKLTGETLSNFKSDYKETIELKIAEHEIMSCIITCKYFDEFKSCFEDDENLDIELIVRSIIGCCFGCTETEDNEKDREKGIKNCLIRLLNSKSVDVDKLDYISRDTLMTGYDNIVIDTNRLLNSVTMVCKNHVFYPAYKKSAISVINNVVTAKTLEAKWIVNHPTILYDSYILEKAMIQSLKLYANSLNQDGDEFITSVFSSEALLKEGTSIGGFKVSLLSDIDILYILKQNIDIPMVDEYFSRNIRKKPVWKSQAEFLYYLKPTEKYSRNDKALKISILLSPLLTLGDLQGLGEEFVINNSVLQKIEASGDLYPEKIKLLNALNALKDFDEDNFEYVLLPAKNKFHPKIDYKTVFIKFGNSEVDFEALEQLETLPGVKDDGDGSFQFFYIYSKNQINPQQLLDHLLAEAEKAIKIRV